MTPAGLETLALAADAELGNARAEEIVRWAVETFGDYVAVTSSTADAVIAHLVSRVKPGIDVLFLDTGYHFAETIGTRDVVAAVYGVNVIDVRPDLTVAEQDARFGTDLFARDPDRCCGMRKVAPLGRALAPYDAWVTGLRRDEAPSRAGTRVVSWDPAKGKVKICPIAAWTQHDVDG